jgi:hypothetical protein
MYSIILHILIHSSFCIMTFVLPARRPNFAEVAHATLRSIRSVYMSVFRLYRYVPYSLLCSDVL